MGISSRTPGIGFPGSRRIGVAACGWLVAAAIIASGSLPARAYDSWSTGGATGNCANCHGDFRALTYVSLSDGATWSAGLHDGHRVTMLNRDCDVCHGPTRTPVALNSSNGGLGFPAISCLGCHGRAEPAAGGAVTGSGLRQHHYRAGVTACANPACHTDANPASFTTAAESVAPPYYFTPDANHPDKPTDPCNANGTESAVAGPRGLDNDGNGLYDAGDAACSGAAVGPRGELALGLEGARPNPASGQLWVSFTLAGARPATLDLVDISGRRVATREVGSLGAGRHVIGLSTGRGLAPGVYVMRLTQDGRTVSKTAILRR